MCGSSLLGISPSPSPSPTSDFLITVANAQRRVDTATVSPSVAASALIIISSSSIHRTHKYIENPWGTSPTTFEERQAYAAHWQRVHSALSSNSIRRFELLIILTRTPLDVHNGSSWIPIPIFKSVLVLLSAYLSIPSISDPKPQARQTSVEIE